MPKSKPRKRKLTELFLRALKPEPNGPFLVWDTQQHGLAIRVQPTGARAWKCIYSRHGRPRWLHLGNARAIGLADARTLAAEVMLAVARGQDPAAERKAERGRGTFEELATRYVEEWAKRKNKSWQQAATLVRRYLLPRWGKLQAASISRADVRTVMASIRGPGAGEPSFGGSLGNLHVGIAPGNCCDQSVPWDRSQPDPQPRARVVGKRDQEILASV